MFIYNFIIMSKNKNAQDDGFKLVQYKNKNTKSKQKLPKNNLENCSIESAFNKAQIIKQIEDAKQELSSSDLFSSVKSSLREGIELLNKPQINEIICFGIGRIGECLISRYQFALLLLLRDIYVTKLLIYDPILTENDTTILHHFKCIQLTENCEGKYNVTKTTLFYMPHCPKQLSNNLLWSNWGLNLTHCLILANSFNTIVENTTKRLLKSNAFYITKILPYCTELAVVNSFKFFEIFNDTALHIFPKLHLISDDLWVENSEPEYIDEDVEFIRKTN